MARVTKKKKPTTLETQRLTKFTMLKGAIKAGLTQKKAALLAQVKERTVRRWLKKGPPKKRGRKPGSTRARIRLAAKAAKAKTVKNGRSIPTHATAKRVAAHLKEKHGIKIGRRQVTRDLRSVGIRTLMRQRHPAVKNKAKRLEFCKIWQHRPPKKNAFSDEHFVSTNDNSCRFQLCAPGERPLPMDVQRINNVPNYQIWACVGYNYRSELVFFPRLEEPVKLRKNASKASRKAAKKKSGWRLNARRYIDMCLPAVTADLIRLRRVFMQDGARSHTAKIVTKHLLDLGIALMTGFPASSPDLNPIESIWRELDIRIAELVPTNLEELRAAAIRAWREMPQKIINSHVLNFQKRCKEVVKSAGL